MSNYTTKWVAENGRSFNVNSSRLAFIGDSVGGNMVAVLLVSTVVVVVVVVALFKRLRINDTITQLYKLVYLLILIY
jgi:hypothetical protein